MPRNINGIVGVKSDRMLMSLGAHSIPCGHLAVPLKAPHRLLQYHATSETSHDPLACQGFFYPLIVLSSWLTRIFIRHHGNIDIFGIVFVLSLRACPDSSLSPAKCKQQFMMKKASRKMMDNNEESIPNKKNLCGVSNRPNMNNPMSQCEKY